MTRVETLDKLNRTDLIKLIAGQVLEDLAGEMARAREEVARATAEFHEAVVNEARWAHEMLLAEMRMAGGTGPLDGKCTTAIYPDEVPDAVEVVFSDGPSFESRLRFTARVSLLGLHKRLFELAQRVAEARRAVEEARERDARVSTIREKVRKDLVAETLRGPGGEEVLTAARKLAALIKAKMLGEGE